VCSNTVIEWCSNETDVITTPTDTYISTVATTTKTGKRVKIEKSLFIVGLCGGVLAPQISLYNISCTWIFKICLKHHFALKHLIPFFGVFTFKIYLNETFLAGSY
jgi:hypothetical protein